MSTCWQRVLTLAGMLSLLLPPSARAQTFTNSATLTAALSGTNLVITYSLMNTQGWVTLFQAGSLTDLATNAQPFDLAPAPGSGQGQFTVPVNPAAPSQFYRLLLEQWPSRGKALVWTNGPLDFAAMRATYGDITNLPVIAGSNCYTGYGCSPFYTNATTPSIFNQPVQVWIDNLGFYDTNGVLVSGNNGALTGKFIETPALSANNPGAGFPIINSLASANNDFRVNYLGDSTLPPRNAVIWSSEAQMYFDVNNYRSTALNDSFIHALQLPAQLQQNLINLQYRPDLNMGSTPTAYKPVFFAQEVSNPGSIQFFPVSNGANVALRSGELYLNNGSLPPMSLCYEGASVVGEYADLLAFWILGTNSGFPSDAFYGKIPRGNQTSSLLLATPYPIGRPSDMRGTRNRSDTIIICYGSGPGGLAAVLASLATKANPFPT